MVRIKKENYEKLQKKRKIQKMEEEYSQKFDIYQMKHKDFVNWLYRFFWEYRCQCFIYFQQQELAMDKPFIQYDDNGQILNEDKIDKLIKVWPNKEDLLEHVATDVHYWMILLIHTLYPDFHKEEFVPLFTEIKGYPPMKHLSRIEFYLYQEYIDKLWAKLQEYFTQYDNILFVDFEKINIENNLFDLFRVIEDAQKYDALLIKNIDYRTYKFLLDFGIEKKDVDLHCIGTIEDGRDYLNKKGDFYNQGIDGCFDYFKEARLLDVGELLCDKHNKTGFDLYDNLQEWKKEVNAPTRDDPEYRKMKKRVRQRDNNTCQCCGYHSDKKTHHNLEVHHIFGYKDHLDYRVEDSNCVVLCQDCHKKYHSLYGRKEVAPDTFMKFIRDYNNFYSKDVQTTLEVHHA